jgi:hypothetical protein
MKKNIVISTGTMMTLLLLAVTGCKTPRDEWTGRLNECEGNSDLARLDKCIYFGPSSAVGPGTVLAKTDSGYEILFRPSDAETNSDTINKFIITGNTTNSCSENTASSWTFDPSLLVSSAADTNANVSLTAALSHSKSSSFTISDWELDSLDLGPYQIASKNWNLVYQNDLINSNSLLITQAYRINGFTATYQFDYTNAVQLQAQYPPNTTLPLSKVLGGSAKVAWTGDKTNLLQLQMQGSFYVFGGVGRIFTGAGVTPYASSWQVLDVNADAKAPVSVNLAHTQ